jgi:hypothetical protein
MLRDAAAMDSNLLGEKIIATSTTRNVTRRVVVRRDGRFMKMGRKMDEGKGK